jgi:hypothetical protein
VARFLCTHKEDIMEDDALVAAFESAQLDGDAFTHVEHVRVAWHYLRTLPLGEAIDRCRGGIRRFAATKGAAGKYHETITVAFMCVINERLDGASHLSWTEFAAANADLFATPSVLSRYYSEDLLRSDRARRVFMMPDLALVEAGTPR